MRQRIALRQDGRDALPMDVPRREGFELRPGAHWRRHSAQKLSWAQNPVPLTQRRPQSSMEQWLRYGRRRRMPGPPMRFQRCTRRMWAAFHWTRIALAAETRAAAFAAGEAMVSAWARPAAAMGRGGSAAGGVRNGRGRAPAAAPS